MIKGRRRPALVHVASRALCDSVLGGELAAVRIGVAGFAFLRRSLELNFVGGGKRLVAFAARGHAMGPDQGEFRFRMVEASNVNPGFGVVTRFAAQRSSIGPLLRHAVFEFALMRIGVAGGARAVREMERQNLVCSSAEARFVAIRAGDGHVSSGQHEAGVLVFGNRERRAMKILYGVAVLAAILVRRGGELFVMRILMAIRARRELHFVQSVFAGRRMAFVASDGRMLSLERIMRCRVLLHAKLRRLPAFDRVAFRTFPLACTRLELPFVRIGSMAIRALGKGQRLLKIASGVAVAAGNFQMHSQERVFCF